VALWGLEEGGGDELDRERNCGLTVGGEAIEGDPVTFGVGKVRGGGGKRGFFKRKSGIPND